jgi:hypothetical protein
MDTDRLNRWLSLGANVGVVIGIVFLAYELRQNSALLEAEAGRQLTQNQISLYNEMLASPEFTEFLAKLKSGEELTDAEKIRERGFYSKLILSWSWEFSEYRAGRLRQDQLPVFAWIDLINNEGFMPTPGMREVWETVKKNRSPDFVAYIDSRLD